MRLFIHLLQGQAQQIDVQHFSLRNPDKFLMTPKRMHLGNSYFPTKNPPSSVGLNGGLDVVLPVLKDYPPSRHGIPVAA